VDINTYTYEGCYEISFFDVDKSIQLGIVLEEDSGYCILVTPKSLDVVTYELPQEVFDMFKDEYKLKRPEVKLPELEEIWETPF